MKDRRGEEGGGIAKIGPQVYQFPLAIVRCTLYTVHCTAVQ